MITHYCLSCHWPIDSTRLKDTLCRVEWVARRDAHDTHPLLKQLTEASVHTVTVLQVSIALCCSLGQTIHHSNIEVSNTRCGENLYRPRFTPNLAHQGHHNDNNDHFTNYTTRQQQPLYKLHDNLVELIVGVSPSAILFAVLLCTR